MLNMMTRMHDVIFINHLHADTLVGIYPHEREQLQPVVLHLALEISSLPFGWEENIEKTVDYAILERNIRMYLLDSKRMLLERLCLDILHICFQTSRMVLAAEVTLEKPCALASKAVPGVKMRRTREDLTQWLTH